MGHVCMVVYYDGISLGFRLPESQKQDPDPKFKLGLDTEPDPNPSLEKAPDPT